MVQSVHNQEIVFLQWIRSMTFLQFCMFCAMLWDDKKKRFTKWHFWKGARGFPGQAEAAQAFEDYAIVWVLKARQLGVSELCALYAIYVCLTEDKAEVIIISKKKPDAVYFLKRRLVYKLKAAFALEMSPGKKFPWPEYVDNSDTGKVLFPETGSWIEAASSDNEEVRSRSPRLVIFDEIRSFSNANAEELWSAIMPVLEANEAAQTLCVSTAKFGTWFNATTKEILAGTMSGIKLLFMPDDTNPKRTMAWRAIESKNWRDKTMFLREHPLKVEDCFISREGAVFSTFDPKEGGRHVNPVRLDWNRKFIIGYDHGRIHPAVLLLMLYDPYENHIYIFDEVFCRGMDLPEISFEIKTKLNFYRKEHGAPDPLIKIADKACFNKDGRRSVAEILRDHTGIRFKESKKHDLVSSIDRVATRFSNNLITIDPRCVNTRRQVAELSWKYEAGESKREVPMDIEDDAPDVIRYVDAELNVGVKSPPVKLTLQQQLKAKDLARRSRAATGHDANPNAWQAN